MRLSSASLGALLLALATSAAPTAVGDGTAAKRGGPPSAQPKKLPPCPDPNAGYVVLQGVGLFASDPNGWEYCEGGKFWKIGSQRLEKKPFQLNYRQTDSGVVQVSGYLRNRPSAPSTPK